MGERGEEVGRCEEVGCAEAVVGVNLDFGLGEGRGRGGRHGVLIGVLVGVEGGRRGDGVCLRGGVSVG